MQTRNPLPLTEEIISLAKKKSRLSPWNKGRKVGPRKPFSPSEVTHIRALLSKRGNAGLRDLALFSTAIDSMLHAPDLLGLTAKDVRKRNRVMRDSFELVPTRGGPRVRCTLSKTTVRILVKWIKHSEKKQGDYLFTGQLGDGMTAISTRQLTRLVKAWASSAGLNVKSYGNNSLRLTRIRKG